jgi:ribonuclease Y
VAPILSEAGQAASLLPLPELLFVTKLGQSALGPTLIAQSTSFVPIIAAVVGFVLGAGILILVNVLRSKDLKAQAQAILDKAKSDGEALIRTSELESKEKALLKQQEVEREANKLRSKIQKKEASLERREESLQQTADDFKKQEKMVEANQRRLSEKMQEVSKRSEQLKGLISKQTLELQNLSGMNRDEARERLLELLREELEQDVGNEILKHERRVAEIAEQKAQEIILTSMQRYASSHTADNTTSTVDIPNDDMKGRIIGREGRNIRAFEKATGVDVIIDDTPGVVIVSGFDPVRREVARQALDTLISDGRIHPSRIEEVVAETEKELEKFIMRKGQEAAEEVNISGLHKKVIYMLGRLHFRTSFSQNVLRHSVEVAFLSGLMAEMIGLDPDLARRSGLLHDIGKAADHELEGGHPKIGADLLKRHGENETVVHAALGHHDQLTTDYPYTLLVATGDACSASRPGARRESLERYIKRMEELESIATDFAGVEQAFAIQAGRELRVIVSAKETDDAKAAKVCRDIAKAFEQQLTYPGEIKVTVVRESRFVEVAR